MNKVTKQITNWLLILYSFIVWGMTFATGMATMMTKHVDNQNIVIVVFMWIVLYVWIQYMIKRME